MANSTQFRQYHISQSAGGGHIEVLRNEEQVAVLAYDGVRQQFVVCRILLNGVARPGEFAAQVERLQKEPLLRSVKILETGEDDGNRYYITELVDGETLSEYLTRQTKVPLNFAWHVVEETMITALELVRLGDLMPREPLEAMRLLPLSGSRLLVKASDFRLNTEPKEGKSSRGSSLKGELKGRLRGVKDWLESANWEAEKKKEDATVSGTELAAHLDVVLQACVPGVEVMLEEWIGKLKGLTKMEQPIPWEAIAEELQPRSLLAAQLPNRSLLARVASMHVKLNNQSAKVEQPYAIWGVMIKGGQEVMVEALPGKRLTGDAAYDALAEVRDLHQAGKFPNLVPVIFVEEQTGVRCVAEAAVNGVSLKELLVRRGSLDVQEAYLVLAGLDVALSQLEKAKTSVRRLRVEDIFLFTGRGMDASEVEDLMAQKLGEWPGFSVVIRVHNSLHSMGGRGDDPATLLPLNHGGGVAVEPLWHGGWMAALGCLLTRRRLGVTSRKETGVAEVDTIFRLLDDELERAVRGEASARAAFLARYARVMQQFHLAQFTQSGGFWTELSGSLSAQDRAAQVSEQVARPTVSQSARKSKIAAPAIHKQSKLRKVPTVANVPALSGTVDDMAVNEDEAPMGFAEIMLGRQLQNDPESRFSDEEEVEDRLYELDEVESSWVNLREERSFFTKLMMVLVASLISGAVLAHLSGRAIWHKQVAEMAEQKLQQMKQAAEAKAEPVIDLPVPKASQDGSANPKAKPQNTPQSSNETGSRNATSPATTNPTTGTALPNPTGMSGESTTPAAMRAATPKVDDEVTRRFKTIREQEVKLTPALKVEAEKAASAGNSEAMLVLARGILNGELQQTGSDRVAIDWLDKAVTAGNGHAMTLLADCYFQGRGVETNVLRGAQLLEAAANLEVPEAKDKLAVCYAKGLGVLKNDVKAFQLSLEAYQAGALAARNNLGAMYLRGQGTEPDAAKAVQLFREGAELGHAESMLALAQCLEYGNGTRVDLQSATQWYRAAARKGNAEAMRWCKEKQVAF